MKRLTPGQRQALMFGAPVVAVFALISATGRKREDESSAGPPAAALPASMASTDAIGTGQLAEFESGVTAALIALQEQLNRQQQTPAAPAAPAPTAAPAPAPAPSSGRDWLRGYTPPAPTNCTTCIPGFSCCASGKCASPIVVQGQTIGVSCS